MEAVIIAGRAWAPPCRNDDPSTRFVSLAKNAKYRPSNFYIIGRQWTLGLGGGGAAAAAAGDSYDDSDEDGFPDAEEDVVAAVTATKRKRIEVVVIAFKRPAAKVHLMAACGRVAGRQ